MVIPVEGSAADRKLTPTISHPAPPAFVMMMLCEPVATTALLSNMTAPSVLFARTNPVLSAGTVLELSESKPKSQQPAFTTETVAVRSVETAFVFAVASG
jgi:hypothetical protein